MLFSFYQTYISCLFSLFFTDYFHRVSFHYYYSFLHFQLFLFLQFPSPTLFFLTPVRVSLSLVGTVFPYHTSVVFLLVLSFLYGLFCSRFCSLLLYLFYTLIFFLASPVLLPSLIFFIFVLVFLIIHSSFSCLPCHLLLLLQYLCSLSLGGCC